MKPGILSEYSDEIFCEDKYTNIDTPIHLFRIGGYLDDKLLSFLEQNN
jgi:hypothetical protein